MRNLATVIGLMLDVIPENEKALRGLLDNFRETVLFSAPETQIEHWRRLESVLQYNLPTSKIKRDSWQETVFTIWTDRDGGIKFTPEGGMYWGR